MKTVIRVLAGLLFAGYLATVDFTPPAPTAVDLSPFSPTWLPVVSTDCETWTIRVRDTAVEDVWPHVDYRTVDGEYRIDTPVEVVIPRMNPTRTFNFDYYRDEQVVYTSQLSVDPLC